MGLSVAGRVAVWTAAISASAVDLHAAPFAFGAAVAKEIFDLLRARLQEGSVLAYLRATRPATSLKIGPSSGSPALILNVGSRAAMQPDDEAGAGSGQSDADLYLGADEFCIKQRGELLAYAMALTRNWPDAEDAVSYVVQKVYEHYVRHGTVCPKGRDAVGWAKTVIHNHVIDVHRRRAAEDKRSRALAPSARDLAEDVTDQILVRNALVFVASLDSQAHNIAMMRWVDGLEPQEIASRLGMNPRSVRTSLHRTKKKMRTVLGVAEPRKILRVTT
jgi:RNA polymerase sigma factor (sigma-70 family)